ncbi:hypothetical protein AWM70_04595 [Paenibacillus yonginensis]|uniref:Uncharacterized protein n=1 Tax=Paenibacillus yonginensis TaxID=1462996 RepID=A0A1B1MXN7_9BACL|nr:hypothetical protein [Paenibacillus yonginensis]ANS73935.1 hypothetical protein AWM70_04595 [Paenibacillus yonginensis]
MRTEQQIKSKINELAMQKKRLEDRLAQLQPDQESQRPSLQSQLERLDDMILMLEWVLNAPSGSYHM